MVGPVALEGRDVITLGFQPIGFGDEEGLVGRAVPGETEFAEQLRGLFRRLAADLDQRAEQPKLDLEPELGSPGTGGALG